MSPHLHKPPSENHIVSQCIQFSTPTAVDAFSGTVQVSCLQNYTTTRETTTSTANHEMTITPRVTNLLSTMYFACISSGSTSPIINITHFFPCRMAIKDYSILFDLVTDGSIDKAIDEDKLITFTFGKMKESGIIQSVIRYGFSNVLH